MDSQGKRPVDLMNFQSFDQDLFDALVGNHDNGYLSHDYLVRQNQESSPEHQQVAETSNQVESLFSHYENVKRQSLLTETATEHTEVPEKRVSSSGSDVVSFGENDDSVNETSSQSAMLSHPNEEFDMETDSHSAMLSHPDEFDMEEEESDASESSEVVSFEEETGSEAEEGNSSISAVEPSLRLGLTTEGDDSEAEVILYSFVQYFMFLIHVARN